MKYSGALVVVSNMEKAKEFYEKVMEQKIGMDLGTHVSFESGFSLQSGYAELLGVELTTTRRSNSFQLYFEVEDIEAWYEKLKAIPGLEFLHGLKEYPWGQRDFRFYDYDENIIEVGEDMVSVVKRLLSQGLSVEETAKRTMYPVEFVEKCR